MSAKRGIRWRLALIVVGAATLLLWRVMAGPPTTVIQIEFGMYPQEFVGATVLIDGEVRGQLERRGARTVNGFKVPEGDHTVQLRLPEIESEVENVTTVAGAPNTVMRMELAEVMRDGETQTIIVLR
jgi:hypothetical protein